MHGKGTDRNHFPHQYNGSWKEGSSRLTAVLLFTQKMEETIAFSRQMKGFQQDECYYLKGGLVQKMEALHFQTTLFMGGTTNRFELSTD